MNCIVIGAGNAGRPVARILNHTGNKVKITDRKDLEKFPESVRKTLLRMKKEGVELQLGLNIPDIEDVDYVYISPTVPEDSPIRRKITSRIRNGELKLIKNSDVSSIINDLIDTDIIGITGTLGKTSATHIISEIFENAGYKVWTCSSRRGNLLSEVIVDGIVRGCPNKKDIAVLEIPHGTSRLMSRVHLTVGVLTNLYRDHLDEFDNSMEKYVARKLFIAHSSDVLVASSQCRKYLEGVREDTIFYCLEDKDDFPDSDYTINSKNYSRKYDKNSGCSVLGYQNGETITIKYNLNKKDSKSTRKLDSSSQELNGILKTQFKLRGYYFENAIAAATAALCYGLDKKFIKEGLSKFHGIPGHMEYVGNYKGREVHFDAAFVPEGLIKTLSLFSDSRLIVLIDNPDSTNPRDKHKIGSIVGKYADVIICSGYNETTKKLDMDAAREVIEGAENSKALKIMVEDMRTAGELAIKHSKPGDVVLHVGPGAITNYEDVRFKMMAGIEEGCKKYE